MLIRWGIIGASGVAHRRAMPAIKETQSAELMALMTRNIERSRQLARQHGAKRFYDNIDDILNDREIDAVYIATPVVFHQEQVIKAAESGKHILCEKPMSMNSQECSRMIEACDKNNVKLMLCFPMRFQPFHRQIRDIITSEKLGQIVEIRIQMVKWMPMDQNAWRIDQKIGGGGALMDIGAHCLDLLRYLAGEFSEIVAFSTNRIFGWNVEETGTILTRFTRGGWGIADVSFTVPYSENLLEIYGTQGSIIVRAAEPPTTGWTEKIITTGGTEVHQIPSINLFKAIFEHFSRFIEGLEAPVSTGLDGLRNIEAIESAYESLRTGKIVPVGRVSSRE